MRIGIKLKNKHYEYMDFQSVEIGYGWLTINTEEEVIFHKMDDVERLNVRETSASSSNIPPLQQVCDLGGKIKIIEEHLDWSVKHFKIDKKICRYVFNTGYETGWNDALDTEGATKFTRRIIND